MVDRSNIELESSHKHITRETMLSYIKGFSGDAGDIQEMFNDYISLEISRAKADLLRRILSNHSTDRAEIARELEVAEATSDRIAILLDSTIPARR